MYIVSVHQDGCPYFKVSHNLCLPKMPDTSVYFVSLIAQQLQADQGAVRVIVLLTLEEK